VAAIAGGGGSVYTSTVAGKDNNQPSGSGRNGGSNCDSNGDDSNGDGDSCNDHGDDGSSVSGGGINNGGDSDSRGAQTTTTRLYPFQLWLLHPLPRSRGSSSTTTSVPTAAPKRKRLQVQRTRTYFNLSTVFFAEASGSSQKLVPHENGKCFWMFLRRLYCI